MNKIAILSDLHGKTSVLESLLEKYEYIIQNGDFSYDYACLECISSEEMVVNRGNHESHDQIKNYPHFLPWYGNQEFGGLKFFNIGGAFSIDWPFRVEKEQLGEWPKTWFAEEEMSGDDMQECLRQYKLARPDFLLCHEAPRSIANLASNPQILKNWGYDPTTFTTRTSELLDRCIQEHMPRLVYFSHYHLDFDQVINGCRFVCQPECNYIEIQSDLSFVKFREDGTQYE